MLNFALQPEHLVIGACLCVAVIACFVIQTAASVMLAGRVKS